MSSLDDISHSDFFEMTHEVKHGESLSPSPFIIVIREVKLYFNRRADAVFMCYRFLCS